MPNQKAIISPVTGNLIPKFPGWHTLPQQPIMWIQADSRVETDIDVNGVGRVRVRPGNNVNIDEVRYGY